MNKILIFFALGGISLLAACTDKQAEGTAIYTLEYKLPDSLKNYAAYLPTKATLHFKGDSAVIIQGSDAESTTMITYKPTDYMLCLLKSGIRRFEVEYHKDEQKLELPDMSMYEFTKGAATKQIAGYKAEQYIMKNKFTNDTTSAWFTHDLKIPQNFITQSFNPEYGVPLSFSIDQNGMVTKTTLKEIKFEPVPAGVFSAPPNYMKLTPQQLREMPVTD